MFKVGDKIMVHGYEEWGEGEIKEENHSIYGDLYVTYFSDKDVSLTSCFQNNFYQTLEQQIISHLSELPIVCEPIKPIIFATSKVDDETLNEFNIGDKVIYTTHHEFGVGTISAKYKNGLYTVDFPNLPYNYGSKAIYNVSPNSLTPLSQSGKFIWREIIDRINKYIDKEDKNTMPNITNYNYNEDTAVTTIEWSDGTKTTVHAEHPDTADPYTGFVTACAKRAFGNNNTINNLFDEWAIKKPEREMIAKIEAENAKIEEQRIAEKRKAKKEKWAIRKRAAEINREYEAKKLAHEKYGVPMDEKED